MRAGSSDRLFFFFGLIQHTDYNAKPIRDGNSKRWGWGKENLFIFGKITQKALRGRHFGKMRP